MLILYDFECISCNHVDEKLVDKDVRVAKCSQCGDKSCRKISAVRSQLDGKDPGFPDAYNKWADRHERAGKGQKI